jgi:hypothetical protein
MFLCRRTRRAVHQEGALHRVSGEGGGLYFALRAWQSGVLKIVQEAEPDSARKKRCRRQRSRSASIRVSDDENDTFEKAFGDSDSERIVVAASTVV